MSRAGLLPGEYLAPPLDGTRRALDFYETPPGAVRAILPFLPPAPAARSLDAGCGTGAILAHLGDGACGVELDPDRARAAMVRCPTARVVAADFLAGEGWPGGTFERVIGNPPYKDALPFVVEALNRTAPGGHVAMLLPITFLATKERRAFHAANPCGVFVLTPRPSFTGNNRTFLTEYAWMVWGVPELAGRWRVLPWDRPERRPRPRGAR